MTEFEKEMREIIPKKSKEDMLKKYDEESIFCYKMKISSLKNNTMPTEKKQIEKRQKDYNRAIIELEFREDKKQKYFRTLWTHYPYDEDICYFDEAQVSRIIKDLKDFDDKVEGISNKDKQIIFNSLNKMYRLLNLIKKMEKNKEKYKTTSRDKPIINALIRLINSNNDKEFTDKLLDELVGYDNDCSKEILDYNNIINYKVKRLNKKPYEEIIFNKVTLNKDVVIQHKKEYNDHYQSICDIHRNYSPRDFKNNIDYLFDCVKLLNKYELH